jgi:hypothetical protein
MRVLDRLANRFKNITKAMQEARARGDLEEVSRLTDQGTVDGNRLAKVFEIDCFPNTWNRIK